MNLLLGDNGAGKSTVLDAALAALQPIMSASAGYVPYRMIRKGAKAAVVESAVELHEQDRGIPRGAPPQRRRLAVSIQRLGDTEFVKPSPASDRFADMFDDRSPTFLVLGYGATRRVEDAWTAAGGRRMARRMLRYQRVPASSSGMFH